MDENQMKAILKEMHMHLTQQRESDVKEMKAQREADMNVMKHTIQNVFDVMKAGLAAPSRAQNVQPTGPEIVIKSLAPHIEEFIH